MRAEKAYYDDPIIFCYDVLNLQLWRRQADILRSVRDNRLTVASTGHGVGKSVAAAALACWWMAIRDPAIVVTSAPTWKQVERILWRHIRAFASASDLPPKIYETPNWLISPERFAIGLSPKKTSLADVQSLQGFHGPNLLVILDEASLLPIPFWEAAQSLVAGESDRFLVLGNPLDQQGPFWRACNSESFHRISISCFEHPNVMSGREMIPGAVSRRWVKERVDDWTQVCAPEVAGSLKIPWEDRWVIPDPIFLSRVMGIAPPEAEDQLIKSAWVQQAQAEWSEEHQPTELVLGLDVARYGTSNSALVCRSPTQVLWTKLRKGQDTIAIAGWTKQAAEETGAKQIYVDPIGVGAGVADQLKDWGLPVVEVNFAEAARDSERFLNRRSECWWNLREALREGNLALPPTEHILARDLSAPHYLFRKRIQLEEKDKTQVRLGRSPDAGDALALTYGSATRGEKASPIALITKGPNESFLRFGGKRHPRLPS